MTTMTEHNAAVGDLLIEAASLILSGEPYDPVAAVVYASGALETSTYVTSDAISIARDLGAWSKVLEKARTVRDDGARKAVAG